METTDGPDSVVFYFLEGGRPRGLQAPASFDTNDLKALVSVQPLPLALPITARGAGDPSPSRPLPAPPPGLLLRWVAEGP